MRKIYCDVCGKETAQIDSVYVSIEQKFVRDQFVPTKHEQEFCLTCSNKVREFIKELKKLT